MDDLVVHPHFLRFTVAQDAQIHFAIKDVYQMVQVVDMSADGAHIIARWTIPFDFFTTSLNLGETAYQLPSHIVWKYTTKVGDVDIYRYGIRWTDLSLEKQEELHRHLVQLQNKQVRKRS